MPPTRVRTAPVVQVQRTLRRPVRFAKRSSGNPAFRPAGNGRLNKREAALSDLYFQMFRRVPRKLIVRVINGQLSFTEYQTRVDAAIKGSVERIAGVLTAQYEDSGRVIAEEVRRAVNGELGRMRIPVTVVAKPPVERSAVTKETDAATVAFDFNTPNPRASTWAANESATLVTNMQREQQQAVRDIMARAHSEVNQHRTTAGATFGSGMTRRQTSSALIDLLETVEPGAGTTRLLAAEYGIHANGLTRRYEQAVANFASKTARELEKKGITGTKALTEVRTKSNKYADKLRRSRAKAIARTEINAAANAGRQRGMEEAIEAGIIDAQYAVKQWAVAAMDVCPVCVPMAGKVVGVYEEFSVQQKPTLANPPPPIEAPHPPAHPSCRCTIQLVPHVREGIPSAIGQNIPGNPNQLFRPAVGEPGREVAAPSLTGPQVVGTPTQAAAHPDDLPDAVRAMEDAARKNPAHRDTMAEARQRLEVGSPSGRVLAGDERFVVERRFGRAKEKGGSIETHEALRDIRKAQGFDDLPDLLTDSQLDDLIRQGGQEMFRGEEAVTFMDDLKRGSYHPGQGVFGNGTYFDAVVEGWEDQALQTAMGYAGSDRGAITRAVLKPDARTVDYRTFQEGAQAAASNLTGGARSLSNVLDDALVAEDSVEAARQAVRSLGAEVKAARSVDEAFNLKAMGLSADDPVGFLQLIDDELVENGVESARYLADWLDETYGRDPGMLSASLGYDALTGVGMGRGDVAGSYVIANNRSAVAFSHVDITHDQARDASVAFFSGGATPSGRNAAMREVLGLTPVG